MNTKEKLLNLIVKNPIVPINPNEICFFQAKGQLVKSVNTTTTTVTKKPKFGLGFVIPLTKHLGLGISKNKAKTERKTTTSINKVPCDFLMLGTRFLIRDSSGISQIDNDNIAGLNIHNDSIEFLTGSGTILIAMDKSDIKDLKNIWELIRQSKQEGITFDDLVRETVGTTRKSVYDENGSIKEEQGNYAKTIFLAMICKNPMPIKKRTEYPQYVFYKLGIQNATAYHEKLLAEGYLQQVSLKDKLNLLKVDELRKCLENGGQETSGKKSELIQRIVDNIDENDLNLSVSKNLYILSEKGEKFVEDNYAYVLIYKHSTWQLDWKDYDSARAKQPLINFYDYCWGIFNKRIIENRGNLSLDRNEYYNMYMLLKEEKKEQQAFMMLLQVFYIDVNVSQFVAPALVREIGNMENEYKAEMIDEIYSKFRLPVQGCKKEVFKAMVEDIIAGTYSDEKYRNKF